MDVAAFKLDAVQIETILDKLVPLIAEPQDHEFFRAVLRIKAEESYASAFSAFVSKLLRAAVMPPPGAGLGRDAGRSRA